LGNAHDKCRLPAEIGALVIKALDAGVNDAEASKPVARHVNDDA
jgi:hypothetical protein